MQVGRAIVHVNASRNSNSSGHKCKLLNDFPLRILGGTIV